MYLSGQMVPGLSAADLRQLDDWFKQGLKLIESAGGVMLLVAAVGLASLAVVRVVVNRTVTAPLAWAVSRAKRVAKGDLRGTPEAQQPLEQTLSFTAAGREFGVPILKVREVLQYASVTELPGAPASVRGVANVRGAAVPVLDLGAKMGLGVAAATKRSCILVIDVASRGEAYTVGVFADAVNEVVDLRENDVTPPPAFGGGVTLSNPVALGKQGKGTVLLVDLDRLLTASEAELAAGVASAVASRHLDAPAPKGG